MDKYVPSYQITDEMLNLVSDIVVLINGLSSLGDLNKLPHLRRVSLLRSIQSSLAIENNSLSLEQVTDIVNGKRVLGPQQDILAVKNAIDAYQQLDKVNPYSITDVLNIHGIMMKDLVEESGKFRSGGVGVFNEKGIAIHMAPPSYYVQDQIKQLFDWVKQSKANMLIKSSIFHYEFEFIHPFQDGNGRMGRLWQTVLLSSWNEIFRWMPIESIIKERQSEYYEAISNSTAINSLNPFIMFMLQAMKSTIEEMRQKTRVQLQNENSRVRMLLNVMPDYPISAQELLVILKLKSRNGFRNHYLHPALDAGLIKMTLPEKPFSKNQKYYKV